MKVTPLPVEKRHDRTDLLAPWYEQKLLAALDQLQASGYPLHVFESYRSPARQEWLYAQGRTRPGKKVTYNKAWESWHQYSVASDLVFVVDGKWTWDGPWEKAQTILVDHGFETLDFEKPHVQITRGLTSKEAYKIAKSQGILAVWDVIMRRL